MIVRADRGRPPGTTVGLAGTVLVHAAAAAFAFTQVKTVKAGPPSYAVELVAAPAAAPKQRLAREAVDLVRRTDFLHLHWYALMGLARVLELLGRIPDAVSAADEAAEAARLKGSVVAERRAKELAILLGA